MHINGGPNYLRAAQVLLHRFTLSPDNCMRQVRDLLPTMNPRKRMFAITL